MVLDKKEETSQQEKDIISNAWKLLHEWNTPPGLQKDGTFDGKHFTFWLEEIKKICDKTGHLEVALFCVEKVLFYTPSDPDGFWINKIVAEALNNKEAEKMRNGLYTEILNSRGVHWVDPTGQPEKELANKYLHLADNSENAGYHRLASTLRNVVESYERHSQRIINEHLSE